MPFVIHMIGYVEYSAAERNCRFTNFTTSEELRMALLGVKILHRKAKPFFRSSTKLSCQGGQYFMFQFSLLTTKFMTEMQ